MPQDRENSPFFRWSVSGREKSPVCLVQECLMSSPDRRKSVLRRKELKEHALERKVGNYSNLWLIKTVFRSESQWELPLYQLWNADFNGPAIPPRELFLCGQKRIHKTDSKIAKTSYSCGLLPFSTVL